MIDTYISTQKIGSCYDALPNLLHTDENTTIINNIPPKQSECCHYTSTEVLDAILKTATFRASHLLYLNDSSELISGLDRLKKLKDINKFSAIREVVDSISIERLPGPFSISFCSESDLLHQWITYAKESGVCIVLDRDILNSLFFLVIKEQKQEEKCSSRKEILDFLAEGFNNLPIIHAASKIVCQMEYGENVSAEIIYKKFGHLFDDSANSEKKEMLEKYWTNNREDAKLYLLLIAGYMKNKSFQEEMELRALFFPEKIDDEKYRKTEINYYKTERKVLRPYINVVICNEKYKRILPLKQIVVGPSGNQNAVFNSVIHRLEYGQTSIWDYWEHRHDQAYSFLKRNFYDYVLGAIKQCSERSFCHINEDLGKEIFATLAKEWIEKNHLLNGDDVGLCWEECAKRNEVVKSVEWSNIVDPHFELIYKYISDNNYFSSQGVWIKTSRIPYIF